MHCNFVLHFAEKRQGLHTFALINIKKTIEIKKKKKIVPELSSLQTTREKKREYANIALSAS